MLICHPQHPLAKLKNVKVKALAGQKFVNFESDIPTRTALEEQIAALEAIQPDGDAARTKQS